MAPGHVNDDAGITFRHLQMTICNRWIIVVQVVIVGCFSLPTFKSKCQFKEHDFGRFWMQCRNALTRAGSNDKGQLVADNSNDLKRFVCSLPSNCSTNVDF